MVNSSSKQTGALMVELIVSMAIMTLAMIPLAFSYADERKLARTTYLHALSMEVIDGEMEILMAGEWRAYHAGTQPYSLPASFASLMPPGKASLTINGNHVRLDWLPEGKGSGGKIIREAEAQYWLPEDKGSDEK